MDAKNWGKCQLTEKEWDVSRPGFQYEQNMIF